MYAVIKTGGKQYKVAPDDIIKVEKLPGAAGDKVEITDVLMVGGDGEPMIGAPLVDGATVTAELVEQARDKKIIIFKKKRRKNYRRKQGHRQDLSVLRITEIAAGGKKAAAKPAAKAKPKKADAKAEPEKKAEKPAPEKEAKPAPEKEAKAAPEKEAPKAKPAAAEADDLKKITGIGPAIEKKLNALGITTFAQIADFKKADIEEISGDVSFGDDWVKEAKALAKEAAKK